MWKKFDSAPKTGEWIDIWAIAKNGTGGGVLNSISWSHDAWRHPSFSSIGDVPGHDVSEHWTPTHWRKDFAPDSETQDALENICIGWNMNWDLKGVTERVVGLICEKF